MQLEPHQRRDLLALLCRVAWADGVVVESEHRRLAELLHQMGEGAVSKLELLTWLTDGPPSVSQPLPSEARDWFYEEALRLITADGDFDPHEMKSVRELVRTCFERITAL